FNPEFEVALVQWSCLAPAVKEPIVFDRIGNHVGITGISVGVEQKVTTYVEKGNVNDWFFLCLELFTDVHVKRYMPAVNVKLDSMSRIDIGKRLLSNMFSLRVPADRSEPLSPVAESISINRNARMCVASSEEHATKVSGVHEGIAVGSKIMLPSTFNGGPWYMYSSYLDALTICRSLGNPEFFITFMCNVKWPEIKRYMAQFPKLTPTDREDIVCRVFEQKEDFLRFLKEVKTFGYVSAEIPDPVQDPRGYKLVTKLMMHGPCGAANLDASCMQNEPCNKHFPKHYNEKTYFDAVQILNVHLEDMQRINFREMDRTKKSLGRLTYIHPSSGDLFYFRMLLCHHKGCKSPDEVRTINCQMLPTFRAACEALGLLGDDKEWDITLE
nr:DNA helicase [Tanacetum cinerariifolium]